MKLSLLIVALFGVAAASAVPSGNFRSTRSLRDDWADFKALIPVAELKEIVVGYINGDAEVQNAIEWLKSRDWDNVIATASTIEQVNTLVEYLTAAGVDVNDWVNRGREYFANLEVDSSVPPRSGGWSALWADLKAALPRDDLRALYQEKLETSESFANLIELATSDRARELVSAVKESERWQAIRARLEAYGIDVEKVAAWVRALIGWE